MSKRPRTKEDRIASCVVIGILIIIILIKGILSVNKYERMTDVCTSYTEGIISSFDTRTDYMSKRARKKNYYAEVTYTVDNQKYILRLPKSSTKPEQGQIITVMYDPSDPERAFSPEKADKGIPDFIFAAILAVMIIPDIIKLKKEA